MPKPGSSDNRISKSIRIIRGNQADVMLNAAVVGGGNACYNLLKIMGSDHLTRLNLKILGVADINPQAPGFLYAKSMNLFTTTDMREIFSLKGLNLIIELTGSNQVKEALLRQVPADVSLIDHRTARLIWDFIQVEAEKTQLETEHLASHEMERRHTEVIMNSLPYRVMVVNMDLTVDTVNHPFLRHFGIEPEDVHGKRCYEIRYGLDRPCDQAGKVCYIKEYIDEIREKKIFSTIKKYENCSGETRFDAITIAPILDRNGEIVQFVEASRDVTDRIKLEHEVQKAKTFFEKVIQSTVDGIVVVDTKGNVLIFNEGMERLTGYSAEEVKHLTSFYPIDVAKENMRKMRSGRYGPLGKLNPTTMTISTKDGTEIPVTISASLIEIDGKEVGSVGVFTDMREVLKMRKDLEEAHLQLVQTERIASVGRMAAGVAHEINNPLSGIMIYAEMLKEYLREQPVPLSDAQEIINQTLRCKKIVSELLEFSRQSIGRVSTFPMSRLIDVSLNILVNQAIFQDIEVIKEIESDMPEMVGDMGQLQQVLINLFINAVDAMAGKGKLIIQGRFAAGQNQFEIRVSDTGPGIPVELQDQIFEIFFTTKSVGKGTGLGLSISKNIVNLHGGNITFQCPPEGGTTFIIELPLGFVEKPSEEPLFIGLEE